MHTHTEVFVFYHRLQGGNGCRVCSCPLQTDSCQGAKIIEIRLVRSNSKSLTAWVSSLPFGLFFRSPKGRVYDWRVKKSYTLAISLMLLLVLSTFSRSVSLTEIKVHSKSVTLKPLYIHCDR